MIVWSGLVVPVHPKVTCIVGGILTLGALVYLFCQYVRSNESSVCWLQVRHIHTVCICEISLLCASSYEFSSGHVYARQIHTGCICETSLHCVFSYAISDCLREKLQNCTGYIGFSEYLIAFSKLFQAEKLFLIAPRLRTSLHCFHNRKL